MLRAIFVIIIVVIGTFYAVMSPFYGLLFYLWHAYFRPEEWIWWLNLRQFHISLIIGVYVVFRTLFSAPDPKINSRTLLILLFLGQSVLCTITSEHPSTSFDFLQDFAKVLLISYFIVVLVTDRNRFRLTLLIIAMSLGFECAKQGWVALIVAPGAKNDNSIGFLGDNNGVAVGTMMLVPILGALAETATRRWERLGHRFMQVGVFLRGITTYSRGGFIAASVLALLVLLRSPKKFRAFLGIFAVVVLVVQVMPREYWDRVNSIGTTDEEEMDSSAAGRLHFWRVSLEMAKARPLNGVGLNAFELSYQQYNYDGRFPGQRAAHSTWFGVLGDLGLPGLALFVLNLASAVFSCWRVVRLSRGDPAKSDLRIYGNALITSLAVFMTAGTFLSSQYDEMVWHFFGLSTALYIIGTSEVPATEPVLSPAPGRWNPGTVGQSPYGVSTDFARRGRP
jgi:probable O-glycosylation ligase (exosortase A-associated)